jgi:Flp pilus assembly protein TadD
MVFLRSARTLPAVVLMLGLNGPAISQGDELVQARQLFRDGQLERALDRVQTYLASQPKDPRGRFLRGVILSEQKKNDEAARIFVELTHDHPELPEPYNNLAVLYAAQGEIDKARVALEMAIRVNPHSAVSHENLGDIYARMAGEAYAKAAQLERNNKSARIKLKRIEELLSGSRGR